MVPVATVPAAAAEVDDDEEEEDEAPCWRPLFGGAHAEAPLLALEG